ncbi:phosphatidylglycerophosphatase a [Trichococcus palustris]|jgi:phosphatidylglycerophosphatase A|uniref:Phosphatidylglycerophosphatase a n=1 Tax=Trichococcus palustris TaxID=140314 RepID=A0A143Z1S0_9LACT|nr:phosphatidylglycerophosphatase A [Trichococcus palustris]CZR02928.1 phosphatidylglycerophosphatase a [Trichococcus palustris]SFL22395.1 Phosphatidylglycerophosphatase A [Trichococcus palustris]
MVKTGSELHDRAVALIEERGVSFSDIADLVLHLQQNYVADLTLEECIESVSAVFLKREVQNAIITGIELDKLAESRQLSQPLLDIILNDEGLYGIDEILALSIVNVYGSIGFTNYGYIDKVKPGILHKLNDKAGDKCHTFLDDIVGAIAAAAASRIAHDNPNKSELMK